MRSLKLYFLVAFSLSFYFSNEAFNNSTKERIYSQFALDYFSTRGLQQVVMFLCWKIEDRINILKLFSRNGISVSLPFAKQRIDGSHLRKLFYFRGKYMGAIFDSFCFNSSTPFFQKHKFFNVTYRWLIFDYGKFDHVVLYVQTLPLGINTDMTITKTTTSPNNTTQIEMYDVYNSGFDRDGNINITRAGLWSPRNKEATTEWSTFMGELKIKRRSDFNGLSIRIVTFSAKGHEDQLEYLTDEHEPNVDSILKMNFALILLLKETHNFTIKFVIADNWSDKNANGFYKSGNLLGIMKDKKADIMAAALLLSNDRLEITDTLHMTYPFRSGFLFRYSGDFGSLQFSFLTPFAEIVWYIVVVLSVLITVTIWCIFFFENKYLGYENRANLSISDTILSVLTAWCQMGYAIQASTLASRLVYMALLLNAVILYNFYTSSIVSSLLSYRSQKFSIIDLADSPMKCGAFDIGYVHNLLFDIPAYPRTSMSYFNAKKKTKDFYYSIEDGIRRVKAGGFAYHAEFSNLYTDVENTFEATEICELQEVDTIPYTTLGILGLKYSPFTEMFRVGLQKARETGQVNRLLAKWVSRKPICQANKGVSEVNIHQIAAVFFVLLCGHLAAILIFIYELRTGRKKRDPNKITKNTYYRKSKEKRQKNNLCY